MKTSTNQLSLHSIKNREKKIDPQPQYQRGSVWTPAKKQLLIDTIFRGYDIPKFYLRVIENSKYEHEVVDGQQRLRSIWEFMNDDFPFGEYSKYFDNLPNMVGKFYSELGGDEQDLFGAFNISITELRDATDLEVTELFRRLQEGSTLTPPEKRNATLGNIRNFIHELSEHQILFKTTMKNDRFQHDDLVAHVTMIQVNGGPVEVKAANLMQFYEQNKDFDQTSQPAIKVKKVLNYLNKVFKDNTPELRIKWGFVDIYWLVFPVIPEEAIAEASSYNELANLVTSGDVSVGYGFTLLNFTCLFGMFALLCGGTLINLCSCNLVATADPRLDEALHFENA